MAVLDPASAREVVTASEVTMKHVVLLAFLHVCLAG